MAKKIILIFLLFIIMIEFANEAIASDKERKGLIFGQSVGLGLISYIYIWRGWGFPQRNYSQKESSLSVMTDSIIGYCLTNRLLVHLSIKYFLFQNPTVPRSAEFWESKEACDAGAALASLSYFAKQQAPSLVVSGGIGISRWRIILHKFWILPLERESWIGLAYSASAGYEFNDYLNVEFEINWMRGGIGVIKEAGKNPLALMLKIGFRIY